MNRPDQATLLELWSQLGDCDPDESWSRFTKTLYEVFPIGDDDDEED